MLRTFRLILTASSLAIASLGVAATGPAMAQGASSDDGPKQVALTQKQIDSMIAAEPEMAAVQAKAQQGPSDRPDPKMEAKMETIAKKHGFAGLDDFEAVSESVGIVMAGIDPDTKTYVGPAAVIKKQMAQVQADKSMPARDKAEAMKELKEAMSSSGEFKPLPGNADLVAKNFEKLAQVFQGEGGD